MGPESSCLRYGQCWEDGDRLVEGLAPLAGRTVLSIASGGENSLALLAEGPARLVALDHNPAQIALLELKLAASVRLNHGELMEFLGAWPCPASSAAAPAQHRLALYRRCRGELSAAAAAFWDREPALLGRGVLGAGRFERYLTGFRRWLLPLVCGQRDWQPLLEGLSREQRAAWTARTWSRPIWRLLFALVFSRQALGYLGTDPSQVRYGSGSQPGLVLDHLRQVLEELDPADNPYLHWILRGHFGTVLPRGLRPETVGAVRRFRDRLELQHAPLARYLVADSPGCGWIERFNLSNVFEYLSPQATTALLARLHRQAAVGSRLLGWNRLADRDGRLAPPGTWRFDPQRAAALLQRDRVFFYKRLILAEVLEPPGTTLALPIQAIPVRCTPPPGPWPADEAWQLELPGGERAQAAIWWQHTPPEAGERLGAIGALAASGEAAAAGVLRLACQRLAAVGCTRVLAPMDGNTWSPYRCRTGAALGFPGEPEPGPEWIGRLHGCGFELEALYLSRRCTDLRPRRGAGRARRRHQGVAIQPLSGFMAAQRRALPAQLHRLLQDGFRRQPWFLPLTAEAFGQWLADHQASDGGDLTLLALAEERLLGLLVAQPWGDTLVVRTLVVQPGWAQAGLGGLLLEEAHGWARQAGCTAVIHALMHERGASLALSRHYSASDTAGYGLLMRRLAQAPGGGR